MKIRVKYTKMGPLRYIGHLDVMRYFQKAIRRADWDIAYSQGYSPHQLITFAAPLGLGITSEGEYFDADMCSVTSGADMKDRLNRTMAEGMEVRAVVALDDDAKTAMAAVAGSDYRISFRDGYCIPSDILSGISAFYEQEEIVVQKRSKTKEMQMDIKPFLYALSAEDDAIFMRVSAGSVVNIKPELVLEAVCRFMDVEYQRFAFRIHRLETYMRDGNGELVSLLHAGKEIP